jgi:nondiscriminating aspartyl-tRNA synthetase
MAIDLQKRTYSKELEAAENAVVAGWIDNIRDVGKMKFLVLRDREGKLQLTLKPNISPKEVFDAIEGLNRESVIVAEGEAKMAPDGKKVELFPQKLEVLSKAEAPLPLEVSGEGNFNLDTMLDWRYMSLRRPEISAIFKIQTSVADEMRDYFKSIGFMEMFSPKLIGSASESGANVFKAGYFGKDAFLAQSPQFYKQMMMATGCDGIFEIGPVFRAENSNTTRHLCEYTSVDFEMAFIKDENDVMDVLEGMMKNVIKRLRAEHKEELSLLGIDLKDIDYSFPRISITEAYKILKDMGKELPEGEDLDSESERLLGKHVKEKFNSDFVFVTDYPFSVRPFYTMKKEKGSKWTKSFDLLYKGQEMTTGGQREHRLDVLLSQAKEKGAEAEKSYFDFFRYGIPPHGGSGTGIERVVQKLLNLPNIREARLLPRDPHRLTP